MARSQRAGEIDVRSGRRAVRTYTDIKDWVPLSPASAMAKLVYTALRMHVNRKRGDGLAWPTQDTLAKMVGLSRGDKLAPYLAELVQLGAIDYQRSAFIHGRNVYIVHEEPPDGYAGPVNPEEWYLANEADMVADRAEAKRKRDARRKPATVTTVVAPKARVSAAKPHVSAVAPKTGEQDPGGAVTPKTGEQLTPKTGEVLPPSRGREPYEVKPDEVKPLSLPDLAAPVAVEPEREGFGQTPKGDTNPEPAGPVDGLVDEALARYPRWSARITRKAIQDELDDGRTLEVVTAAWRAFIADGQTTSPNRFKYPRPWWDAASKPPRPAPAASPQRLANPADCGRCTSTGVGSEQLWVLPSGRVCRHEPVAEVRELVAADAG